MTYTVDQLKDSECIRVVFSGRVTEEQHYEARDDANIALSEAGWNRLLVDATEIDAEMTVVEDYQFTKDHPFSLPPTVRMAILHRPDEEERFRFIENVAKNRGSNLKIFTDQAEAIAWLIRN